jgi:hypothetical protein
VGKWCQTLRKGVEYSEKPGFQSFLVWINPVFFVGWGESSLILLGQSVFIENHLGAEKWQW